MKKDSSHSSNSSPAPTKPEDLFRAEKERAQGSRNSQHARLLAEAKAAFDKLMAEGQAARKSGRPRKHPLPPLKTSSSRTPPPKPPAAAPAPTPAKPVASAAPPVAPPSTPAAAKPATATSAAATPAAKKASAGAKRAAPAKKAAKTGAKKSKAKDSRSTRR